MNAQPGWVKRAQARGWLPEEWAPPEAPAQP